jgi:hypothetical protein
MSTLGAKLRELSEQSGESLKDLTVLSPQNDPFRLDTPANHVRGKWLRDGMALCGLMRPGVKIHNRGIFYALLSQGTVKLPDGTTFANSIECWAAVEEASMSARWLGYIEWERITDNRNDEPVTRVHLQSTPSLFATIPAHLTITEHDLTPLVFAGTCAVKQPYRLAIFGEKTSLENVLGPLAERYQADLYLATGEISNTQIHTMAKSGSDDGRELIVFAFTDCDPAGYQMAVSIAHKLRAFKERDFPELRFRLYAPALTVHQVKELGLPSTPLKETERRAAGWREKHGVEQTEIDAIATLRPEVLRSIAASAIDPFYDGSLNARIRLAVQDWEGDARQQFIQQVETDQLFDCQAQAKACLNALQDALAGLSAVVDEIEFDIPFQVPEPEIDADSQPAPLVSSEMPLIDAIKVLKDRKLYAVAGDA